MLDKKEFLKPLLENPSVSGVVHTAEYMLSTPRMRKKGEGEIYIHESYSVHFCARMSEDFTKLIETLNDMEVNWALVDENTIDFVPSSEMQAP